MQSGLQRRSFLKALSAGVAGLSLPGCSAAKPPAPPSSKPNILLIMADDIGAECFSCYGSTSYSTPRLDELASTGMQFQNAYSTPLCTPTRAQIMTGRYPFRTGWSHLIERGEVNGLNFFDPSHELTFAHLLKTAGYATAVAGKWQLARFSEHPNHARACGFDEHCLWAWKYEDRKSRRYWQPGVFKNGDFEQLGEDVFGPDVYTDSLIDFIRRHHDRPFFAYYPMALTHGPFVPPPGTSGRKGGTRKNPKLQENFSAMVEYTDALVGRLVDTLDELGVRDNTLILFTSDNGTHPLIQSRIDGTAVEGGKGDLTEAGTRVPFIANWRGTTPAKQEMNELVDLSDVFPTFASVAGARIPAHLKVDGRDMLPLLTGESERRREWVFAQHKDDWFIRDERWRLRKNGELADMSRRYRPRIVESPAGEALAAQSKLKEAARLLLEA